MRNYIVSTLRDLCIKHDFFNAGTNEQYSRMFDLAVDCVENAANLTIAAIRISSVIWICTADAEYSDIYAEVYKWMEKIKERKEVLHGSHHQSGECQSADHSRNTL